MATQPGCRDGVERAASFRGPLLAAAGDPARVLRRLRRLGRAGAACRAPRWRPAIVAPEGFRKTIQHLEGGIVSEIRVREGSTGRGRRRRSWSSTTRAPAPSTVGARAQLVATLARGARLAAEQAGAAEPAFPDDLMAEAADGSGHPGADGRRARKHGRAPAGARRPDGHARRQDRAGSGGSCLLRRGRSRASTGRSS